jgi:hypothetical protein
LSPKGEFWNRLERTLDLSKNVSEPAKNDLGNSPSNFDIIALSQRFSKATLSPIFSGRPSDTKPTFSAIVTDAAN